jgi:hypothetical protein
MRREDKQKGATKRNENEKEKEKRSIACPQILESGSSFSAAKMCPSTTFFTWVKSTMFFPLLKKKDRKER